MTDAELMLVEEVVARLRDGLPIHDVAGSLDPELVELATAIAGEMAEVGWLADQAVPGGFDAVWQGVAALGGVGASSAAAASVAGGGAGAAGGGVASGVAGASAAGGGATAGGIGSVISGVIGGIGGTTAAIAGSAVVASAVVAAVVFGGPRDELPVEQPPTVTAPEEPGVADESEPDLPELALPDAPSEPTPVPPAEPPEEDPTEDEAITDGDTPGDAGDGPEAPADPPTSEDTSPPGSDTSPDPSTAPSVPSTPPSTPAPTPGAPSQPDPGPRPSQPEPPPPVARDVTVTVVSRDATTIDVLANDEGPQVPLDRSSLRVVSDPSHGVTTVSGGRITYRSDALWLGADSFTYRVCDLDGRCAQAKVTATTRRKVETSDHRLPAPAPQYSFSLGSHRDLDSVTWVELGSGRVDRQGTDSWRWLGPPGRVEYPVQIVAHVANLDGSMSELRMTLRR